MKVFELLGFAPDQLEGPRQRLAMCSTLRRSVLSRARTAGDTSLLLGNELDRARLANALGVDEDLQDAILSAASFATAMTVRERVTGGLVELAMTSGESLQFPDGDTGAAPALWLDGLACAVIARDANACEYLANMRAFDCVFNTAVGSARPIGAEPFWPDYARAFIALVKGRPEAVGHAQRARQQIATGDVGVLVREALMITDAPVLRLIEIVAARATTEWPAAIAGAIEAFHGYFANDERNHSLPGYLPLGMLAVCTLAIANGFPPPPTSPYLPPISAAGNTALAVRYPPQAIMSAEEAHWFLDLAGYPRAGRAHRLLDDNGILVAHYETGAANGLPPAAADFAYTPGDDARFPLALDAGQLLFLAQAFAEQVRAGPAPRSARARILLRDAVACVDAALARIPAGMDTVPRDAIRNAEGLALLASEPGRFRRSRLAAYRAALSSQLASLPSNDDREELRDDIRTRALSTAETIRAQAMPLLAQFARSTERDIVATLRPREGDYEKVFVADAARDAREAYEALWSGDLHLPRPSAAQTDIRCAVAPAGMLTWRNELSEQFPSGYQGIATLLDPHRVWLAWKYLEPGKPSGVSFDGLVWVDDHWAWFPKPYRYLVRGAAARDDN